MSAESLHKVQWNFPDAEESEYMVDTKAVEVFLQLMEAAFPPVIVAFLHRFPVIGREKPVLSVNGEIVGRRSRLTVEVEVFRFCPDFDTATVDSDGKIPFQHDSVAACIVGNRSELSVENELQEEEEGDLFPILILRRTEIGNSLLVIHRILFPLGEVGSSELVTKITVGSIRQQPFFVLCKERLEVG